MRMFSAAKRIRDLVQDTYKIEQTFFEHEVDDFPLSERCPE